MAKAAKELDGEVDNLIATMKASPSREYRVKPVLRYIITEYTEQGPEVGSRPLGEYDSKDLAVVVANGIAKANGGLVIIPGADYRALAAKLHDEYGIVG